MWKYFVDATAEIIEEEGVENVTIRKVADRAGYNSATIYNYFQKSLISSFCIDEMHARLYKRSCSLHRKRQGPY